MSLTRYFTLGSAGYSEDVVKHVPAGCVPSILISSLNKKGQKEDFKGNPWKALNQYLDSPKFPNGVFVVGLWRDNHDFSAKDVPLVIEQAKKLEELEDISTRIYFMPFLEHTLPAVFINEHYGKIEAAAPSLILVNNPANYGGRTGEYAPQFLNEVHLTAKPKGQKPPPNKMIYCFDGVNAFDADFQSAFHSSEWGNAHMRSVWIAGFNRRLNTNDTTIRPKRIHKPVKKDYQGLHYLTQNESGGSNLKKAELYKSNADRHSPGDTDKRAGLPVFIIPQKGKLLVIKDEAGRKVFSCEYDKLYKDGVRHVYRPVTNLWGYEYCLKLLQAGRLTRCKLLLDGEKIGDLDPAYRAGDFRTS